MTYHLYIYHHAEGSAPLAARKYLDLEAVVAFDPSKAPRVIDAKIDHVEGIELTEHGQNAFRCLCLAEEIIANALHLPTIQNADKQAIAELEAEVQRLRARINQQGTEIETLEKQIGEQQA